MTTSSPTIVLVHGAFAESASWNPVIERLRSRTPLEVIAVGNQLRSLAGDAAYVRDVIEGIGTDVILVGHSYGGMVITEAAAGCDAVIALVYVAAFAPDAGESSFDLSTRFPGSSLGDALIAYPVAGGGVEVAIDRSRFHEQFAADLPADQATLLAATQRPVTQAALSEGLPSAEAAWRRLPSWFVFAELDRNIPAALSRSLAQRAGARGTTEVAGASHAISLSRPDAVADTILEAVAAMTAPVTVG